MKKMVLLLSLLMVIILVGCGKNSASKKNFSNAIDTFFKEGTILENSINVEIVVDHENSLKYIDRRGEHLYSDTFFLYVVKSGNKPEGRWFDLLSSLVELGFLTEAKQRKATYKEENIWNKKIISTDYDLYEYYLTEEGNKNIKAVGTDYKGEPKYYLVTGEKEIVEILNFSKPSANLAGEKISKVSFTYKYNNLDSWFLDKKLTKYFPKLQSFNGEELRQEEITLHLTSDGWKVKTGYSFF